MSSSLKTLVNGMDNAVGLIGLRTESLADVEVVLSQLRQSMDDAVHRGEERLYYHEHHRQVSMLSELLRYLVNDLNEAYNKASKLSSSIFDDVIKKGDRDDQNNA